MTISDGCPEDNALEDDALEDFLPDHGAIVEVISSKLHIWFPMIPKTSCDNFAFHIVHDVLTIRPVIEGSGIYSLFCGPPGKAS